MELLTAVISRLLSMALMALPVMAVVVLVRLAMARLRVPRKYSCVLWLAVGVRLVCPVSLRGLLSIFDLPGLYDLAEATGSVDGAVSALPPVAAVMAPARSRDARFLCFILDSSCSNMVGVLQHEPYHKPWRKSKPIDTQPAKMADRFTWLLR